ncbi:MAG: LamB/YcsF family protein [Rhodanobacter denitrificans]|uniref:5-oxoprolinase subunit A n=1 Tax=Rhodanobacter denitrificans TaxID=666685 RepID=A0A2W5MF55_9GAMM|nr:MAG: LamB/YcsF family protein [Rhodanobacter denitrificans]
MTLRIDLNADIGESYGAWRMSHDAEVLREVSSVNIACGFHAGDPSTMRATVRAAIAHGVAIGAHPSLPDLQGFGRREMAITPDEAYALVVYQTGALAGFAAAAGGRLAHVKPHGALYNMAARDPALADAIATAVHDVDRRLILVGLAASALTEAAMRVGIPVAHEVFADRRYEADGSLTPRSHPDAVIHDLDIAIVQVVALATRGEVTTRTGERLRLAADTICLHGDRPDAGLAAQRIRSALTDAGVTVAPL